jgi:hypothetical protein
MAELFNNPWVIGIVGGFIVTAISQYLFSRRDNKEYRQKVVTANQEILYAIRPGVSEEKIASLEVLKAILIATASKYGVEENDLYQPTEISNHLIKEVMDSSFISVELKQKYCNALATLKAADIKKEQSEPETDRKKTEVATISEYRNKLVTMLSVMLGIFTGIMTVGSVYIEEFKFILDTNISLVMPTVVATTAVLIFASLMPLFRILKNKDRDIIKSKYYEVVEENNS